jgi:hypothetical protein
LLTQNKEKIFQMLVQLMWAIIPWVQIAIEYLEIINNWKS